MQALFPHCWVGFLQFETFCKVYFNFKIWGHSISVVFVELRMIKYTWHSASLHLGYRGNSGARWGHQQISPDDRSQSDERLCPRYQHETRAKALFKD